MKPVQTDALIQRTFLVSHIISASPNDAEEEDGRPSMIDEPES